MQTKDPTNQDDNSTPQPKAAASAQIVTADSAPKTKSVTSSQIVTADSVHAEEVPTVPIDSLQTLSRLQPEVSVHSVASTESVRMPTPLVVQPVEYRRSMGEWMHVWWDGIRPIYFLLSILPVVLGSVVAWTQSISTKMPRGDFHPQRFAATLGAIILLQAGANLVNDYYDYLRGIDTTNSLGPGGLIQQGLIRPSRVLSMGLVTLVLGAALGILVVLYGGLYTFLFGAVGVLVAFFYSATSRSLSSLTLGELTSFCIFGPLLTLGAYLVQTGHVDRMALLYSLPLGLLATAAIHVNNMRDMESDAQAGKHTLATMLGLPISRILCVLLLLGAFAPIVALGVPRHGPHLLLITLWTLPGLAVALTGVFRTTTPAGLHVAMRQILKSMALFTVLLVVALVVMAYFPLLPHLPSLVLPF